MNNESAIEFKDVCKGFNYWSERHRSLKTALIDLSKISIQKTEKNRIEVIKSASFNIRKGEFVAIMGRNGAGKSTILKLISKIYEPDKGEIKIHGQIAPMIELGAGFDPELSGYENVLLNASILGYSRKEALANMDKIIEFSELKDLIEMPIKNYSSGMLVRLGFSVATHLSAPILLVDEVLAVGDVGFQQKCIKKIKELHQAGRTIVLVTHDPLQAKTYTQRTIVLNGGIVEFDGDSATGADVYLNKFKV